jgi:hypothetical protein
MALFSKKESRKEVSQIYREVSLLISKISKKLSQYKKYIEKNKAIDQFPDISKIFACIESFIQNLQSFNNYLSQADALINEGDDMIKQDRCYNAELKYDKVQFYILLAEKEYKKIRLPENYLPDIIQEKIEDVIIPAKERNSRMHKQSWLIEIHSFAETIKKRIEDMHNSCINLSVSAERKIKLNHSASIEDKKKNYNASF